MMSNFFTRVTKAHIGEYLAAQIAECLREYGVQDKVLVPTIHVLCISASIIYRSWDSWQIMPPIITRWSTHSASSFLDSEERSPVYAALLTYLI
jgi:p-aminobenzoyl-glutamate transporter AbgT